MEVCGQWKARMHGVWAERSRAKSGDAPFPPRPPLGGAISKSRPRGLQADGGRKGCLTQSPPRPQSHQGRNADGTPPMPPPLARLGGDASPHPGNAPFTPRNPRRDWKSHLPTPSQRCGKTPMRGFLLPGVRHLAAPQAPGPPQVRVRLGGAISQSRRKFPPRSRPPPVREGCASSRPRERHATTAH